MNLTLRPARPSDADAAGSICYHAFRTISEAHNFPPDFPNVEAARGLMTMMLGRPDIYGVAAEVDGRLVGTNFLWEGDEIAGIGPITVDPSLQNSGVGRRLMDAVMERAHERRAAGVRLVQAGYHMRSLSLYSKLGFDVREPLLVMQGAALNETVPGHVVRPANERDVPACAALCLALHGHERTGELRDAIHQETAMVVEHDGRITGYATMIGFFGHAVASSNNDLRALIGAAKAFAGPGFLLPARNVEVLRWCLHKGLRAVQPMTLMSMGLYNEPHGPFLPSILL